MPSRATIAAAMAELELQGLSISVEHIRGLTGGSPRDICKHLREIRSPTPPTPPPVLSLADLVVAAKRCVLSHVEPLPGAVLDMLNVDRKPRATMSDLWHAVVPACTNAQDVAACRWKLETLTGRLVWSQGEPGRLNQLWQRLIVAPIGKISEQERRAFEGEQWAKMAQQRRQAEAHERLRQLQ